MNPDANELRNRAFELLNQAEQLDGLKPHILICTGGYDEPTTTVLWSENPLSDEDVAQCMGFEDSDYDFFNRELSLVELMSNVKEL